jgi:hypothetical protein
MKLELQKYGDILTSRPDGREAWLSARAYNFNDLKPNEKIEVSFDGVKVLTPGWADEFISALKKEYPNRVVLLPSDNKSVKLSLEFVGNSTISNLKSKI